MPTYSCSPLVKTFVAFFAAAALCGTAAAAAQAPPIDRDLVLKLARDGRTAEAWKAWEAMPRTPDALRTGIALAVATGQLARGVELYETLVTGTRTPDRPSLTALALKTAEQLSASKDVDVRVNACAAALLLDKAHAACRTALNQLAQSREPDEQALAVYSLANAGVRQNAAAMSSLATTMSKPMRLQLAQRMKHLSGAERLALLQPLLDDPDVATRYEAVLSTTEIPGPEVEAALRKLDAAALANPLKTAVMLALARHGDTSKLDTIVQYLPYFSGFDKVTAARVLTAANDKRGVELLNGMLKSSVDIERLQAAEALAQHNQDAARRAVLESLTAGGAAVRQPALAVAGSLQLGTEPAIYRKLTDTAPAIRAAAVESIGVTFSIQDNRARPAHAL